MAVIFQLQGSDDLKTNGDPHMTWNHMKFLLKQHLSDDYTSTFSSGSAMEAPTLLRDIQTGHPCLQVQVFIACGNQPDDNGSCPSCWTTGENQFQRGLTRPNEDKRTVTQQVAQRSLAS